MLAAEPVNPSSDDPQPQRRNRPRLPRSWRLLVVVALAAFSLIVLLVAESPVPGEVADQVNGTPEGAADSRAPRGRSDQPRPGFRGARG